MDDAAILRVFCTADGFRDVQASDAYEAFVNGMILADVSPNAELLEDFYQHNKAEFYGDMIVRHPDGHFAYSPLYGRKVWITYHKHKLAENHRDWLQTVIQECPWLDG